MAQCEHTGRRRARRPTVMGSPGFGIDVLEFRCVFRRDRSRALGTCGRRLRRNYKASTSR
jgi:hypothetical protein